MTKDIEFTAKQKREIEEIVKGAISASIRLKEFSAVNADYEDDVDTAIAHLYDILFRYYNNEHFDPELHIGEALDFFHLYFYHP